MKPQITLPEQLEEIRNVRAWINYIMVWNESKHGGEGGFDKPPVNPLTLRDGSSTDSSRWTTFDEAVAQIGKQATVYYKNQKHVTGEVAGVGLILEAVGLVGIDFDGVVRNIDGQRMIDIEAREIWKYIDSYSEVSPSGTGVHILARGKKPSNTVSKIKNERKVDGSIYITEYEIYDKGRYFTFTGKMLKGCQRGLEERQEQINKVFELFEIRQKKNAEKRQSLSRVATSESNKSGARVEVTESDRELWDKMFKSNQGAEIRRLYDGDTSVCDGDHSACDLALCNHLAYWTNLDSARIDRMFRQSGLMRSKWSKEYVIPKFGQTYRDWTISTALSDKSEFRGYSDEEKKQYAQQKEKEEFDKWNEEFKKHFLKNRKKTNDSFGDRVKNMTNNQQ